jgi:iron(III) transport system permease protein
MSATPALLHSAPTRPRRWLQRLPGALLLVVAAALALFLLLPLAALLLGSLRAEDGQWSLAHFRAFAAAPGMWQATWNTLWVAALVTAITVPLAFVYAYAIQRACLPLKGMWRLIGLSALLGPSLVGAIAFIQWFGTQGVLVFLLGGHSVYGPIGIVMATVYASFPHALLILLVALATTDARLYEAAEALGASRWRRFRTVTLPAARYGLISAAMLVFAYSVSEFGIPKVIGGNFPVLAMEVYVQTVGLQNFERGAVVALLLLLPVLAAFVIDYHVQRRQQASLSARAVPYQPRPDWKRDAPLLLYCLAITALMLGVLGMTAYTSVISFWPWDLSLTLEHYTEGLAFAGVLDAYYNSLTIAALTALFGTPFIFLGAWLLEKTHPPSGLLPALVRALAALPMGIPGLVLGLGYIFFFNAPGNPFNALFHTLAIMVICTVVHFYTACHLSAVTALKSIDREFEAVSASLKVSTFVTLWRVTLPICLPAVLDIARYLFINAMTTISALVFLYSPDTLPAAVTILHLDEAGKIGPAAAMATLIVLTCAGASLLYSILTHLLLRQHQAWRNPPAH